MRVAVLAESRRLQSCPACSCWHSHTCCTSSLTLFSPAATVSFSWRISSAACVQQTQHLKHHQSSKYVVTAHPSPHILQGPTLHHTQPPQMPTFCTYSNNDRSAHASVKSSQASHSIHTTHLRKAIHPRLILRHPSRGISEVAFQPADLLPQHLNLLLFCLQVPLQELHTPAEPSHLLCLPAQGSVDLLAHVSFQLLIRFKQQHLQQSPADKSAACQVDCLCQQLVYAADMHTLPVLDATKANGHASSSDSRRSTSNS